MLGRSAKQVASTRSSTSYQVYCKKQAERFSQSERKRIDREGCFLYLRFGFSFLFFLCSIVKVIGVDEWVGKGCDV